MILTAVVILLVGAGLYYVYTKNSSSDSLYTSGNSTGPSGGGSDSSTPRGKQEPM